MRKRIIIVGAVLAAIFMATPVKAADTSDVIAGIIFGGLLGSEIQKNREYRDDYPHPYYNDRYNSYGGYEQRRRHGNYRHYYQPSILILPDGTIIEPRVSLPRVREDFCWYVNPDATLPRCRDIDIGYMKDSGFNYMEIDRMLNLGSYAQSYVNRTYGKRRSSEHRDLVERYSYPCGHAGYVPMGIRGCTEVAEYYSK
tara:strand:+ start:5551 stop:6144 length:594 start_codon:yes stop_codon:yes gene_type:complete